MKRIHLIAAATLAALSLQSAAQTANAPAKAKATVAVTSTADAGNTSLEAVVEAVRQTTLSAQVPGAIVAVLVRAGDRVQAGQTLVRIDARAAQQNVAGSAAQVEAAQAALDVFLGQPGLGACEKGCQSLAHRVLRAGDRHRIQPAAQRMGDLRSIIQRKADQAQLLLRSHIEQSKAEVRKITLSALHEARERGVV
mgnify:CR=1 FL=1